MMTRDEQIAQLANDHLDRLEQIAKAATPGPWAWEWIAEQSNEWAVGQAWDVNGQRLSGHICEPEELTDTTIERRRLVGMNESGHARAADATHIAAFHPETAQQLITALRTEREARETAERERDEAKAPPDGDCPTCCGTGFVAGECVGHRQIRAERDALAQQIEVQAGRLTELAEMNQGLQCRLVMEANETTLARQQVEALRQELATAIGQNEELRKRDSQWQLKWSQAVGTGTSNTARETDRANKAESALTTAQQDAARLREALVIADTTAANLHTVIRDRDDTILAIRAVVSDYSERGSSTGQMFEDLLTDVRAALTAPADPTGGQ